MCTVRTHWIQRLIHSKIPEDTEEKKDILIGLTGEDWPSKKTRLIAWKLELRSSDQRILAQKQSFLWEHEK